MLTSKPLGVRESTEFSHIHRLVVLSDRGLDPILNEAPVAQAKTDAATEGGAVINGSVVATDADDGATLTYSLTGPAPGYVYVRVATTYLPAHGDNTITLDLALDQMQCALAASLRRRIGR